MKQLIKRMFAFFLTSLVMAGCILSASALTDEETTLRKRAYYAGIDSTVSLLSEKLGNLSDATIERIVITSLQDFTSEDAVKENVQSEVGKLKLGYTVEVTIQFSARDGETTQRYIFDHYLPSGTTCTLTLATKHNLTTGNYNDAVSYFTDYGASIGNGIAHTAILRDTYYLDIDLSDYKNSGYSLLLPYVNVQVSATQEVQSETASAIAEDSMVPTEEPKTDAVSEVVEVVPSDTQTTPNISSVMTSHDTASSSTLSESKSSVKTVPATTYKPIGLMVWIPTNGGKRYHSNSSCSGMINPRRVDLGEARYLGFTACGRCYR